MKAAGNKFRIIGGVWRGRVLSFPDGEGLRPTTDRIRETLFNWLRDAVTEACCLDLFAGSGALSLEALSRGARAVTSVERSRRAVARLEENARLLGAGGLSVVRADALAWLAQNPPAPFDIVFLDPPYADRQLERACGLLEERGWLGPEPLVYVEDNRPLTTLVLPGHWALLKSSRAGQVHFGLCGREDHAR